MYVFAACAHHSFSMYEVATVSNYGRLLRKCDYHKCSNSTKLKKLIRRFAHFLNPKIFCLTLFNVVNKRSHINTALKKLISSQQTTVKFFKARVVMTVYNQGDGYLNNCDRLGVAANISSQCHTCTSLQPP